MLTNDLAEKNIAVQIAKQLGDFIGCYNREGMRILVNLIKSSRFEEEEEWRVVRKNYFRAVKILEEKSKGKPNNGHDQKNGDIKYRPRRRRPHNHRIKTSRRTDQYPDHRRTRSGISIMEF